MKLIKNPWLDKEGYNCIGCCPTNPMGFRLSFYEDGDDVVSKWNPTQNHQGWIDTLHGGVQALLMDEVAGWVVTSKLQMTGVTSKMEIQYMKPISTRLKELTIRARLNRMMRNVAFIDAEIIDEEGEICSKSQLVYFCKKTSSDFQGD